MVLLDLTRGGHSYATVTMLGPAFQLQKVNSIECKVRTQLREIKLAEGWL